MFIIVNLHNRTGEGNRVEVGWGGGGVGGRGGGVEGGRANNIKANISLTITLFERILRKTSLSFDQIFL